MRRTTLPDSATNTVATVELARRINRAGHCSRSAAEALVRAGRVQIDGIVCTDPTRRTQALQRISIDGALLRSAQTVVLMLNKPRGMVTTAQDERGRPTVFACFGDADLPHIGAVGRLDAASEGLLLFTNDTALANAITAPNRDLPKIYHVQVDGHATPTVLAALVEGVVDRGETLRANAATLLRAGEKTCWLEITLTGGRNRQIRRALTALGLDVLRLIRVQIGPLVLGELGKGQWRHLTPADVATLRGAVE